MMEPTQAFTLFISTLVTVVLTTMVYAFYKTYVLNSLQKIFSELEKELGYLCTDLLMKHNAGMMQEEEFIQRTEWLGQLYNTIAKNAYETRGRSSRKERVKVK